jgi:decaprenylphospho-beta-D-erythro-pentofuranosid-2-ulose 2-reductase
MPPDKPRRVLVLGATSAIAQAYARRRAAEGAAFMLAGRRADRLAAIGDDLKVRGAASTEVVEIDLALLDTVEASARDLRTRFGEPDEILIAYGVMPAQAEAEANPALARAMLDANLTSVVVWTLALLHARPPEAPLTLIGIGSVAGDRGRASNFIYGATKGGFERFFEGLAHKYAGSAVHVLVVKPGPVDTPMTAGMPKGGFLWSTPEQVADDMHRAVRKGRRSLYTPWFWGLIMLIIRCLPWFVFRRMKGL